jgi:hypothetical protein
MGLTARHFEVSRSNIREHRRAESTITDVPAGQVLLRIQHFALTSNNITYGAFGDVMGYWNFFPTGSDAWGRVPVWGFAEVLVSEVEGIVRGERFYGYLPMSTHLLVTPGLISAEGFTDVAAHRSALPSVYNQYSKVAGPMDQDAEERTAVLRPLFTTSFLIDDFLGMNELFGATSVIVASASSKTALALGYMLSANERGEVIGLTSAGNAEFVGTVGYYDRAVTYGTVAERLDASRPTVLVDMGGDAAVLAEVHEFFGDNLRYSCQVGATHWDKVVFGAALPGPAPQMFFAPSVVEQRIADWGADGFRSRLGAAWNSFEASSATWLHVREHADFDAIGAVYSAVLEGRMRPNEAHVVLPTADSPL